MKQKQITIVAVAGGLICAACVALFMASVQGEADSARAEALARYGGEQVEAYVATRDIIAGERVDLSAVETKLWVADLLPESAVRSSSDVAGKTATSTIYKGEVITSGRFEVGQGSIEVPAGKQAVSVPAKAVQAVGGAIHPGMSIDIYSSGDSSTTVIASNVNVLDTSVGATGTFSSSDNGWITLAVEPEKVQEIISASSRTTLYFTLPGADIGKIDSKSSSSKGDSEKAESEKRKPDSQSSSSSTPSGDEASAAESMRESSESAAQEKDSDASTGRQESEKSEESKESEGGDE